MSRLGYFFGCFVWVMVALLQPAFAQDNSTLIVAQEAVLVNFEEVSNQINAIENKLESKKLDDKLTKEYMTELSEIRSQVEASKKFQTSELESLSKKISLLGDVPENGEETTPIAQTRKKYNDEALYYKGVIAENDIIIARVDELTSLIFEIKNQELINDLLAYQKPLIYPTVLIKATGQLFDFGFNIIKSPLSWYGELDEKAKNIVKGNILWVVLYILVFSAIGLVVRIIFLNYLGYRKEIESPLYFQKVIAALFVACARGVIPAVLLGGFLFWMKSVDVLKVGFLGLLLSSFVYYSLLVFLANAIVRVIFAPYNPKWRLVRMEDNKAKHIAKIFYFSFVLVGVLSMLSNVAQESNYPPELVYLLSFIATSIKVFCVLMITKSFLWEKIIDEQEKEEDIEDGIDDVHGVFSLRMVFLSIFGAIVVIGISAFGYSRLAEFIINRFIISIFLIGLIIAIRKSLFEVIKRVLLFRFWFKRFKIRRQLIKKLDFWLAVLINPVFMFIGAFLLLGLWGVPTDLLIRGLKKLLLGFKVGGVEISIIAILMGFVVFFVALHLVKILRKKLLEGVLSHLEVDEGIRHSLAAGFGFVGFVISLLLAIGVMGADLSSIALVAGALSVGIGLGLQGVVNNFVSGIILLFERPIKVGDWVVINGEEGRIKQVNIRATEMETFEKSSLIIPNATLLSTTVTNLTHDRNTSRHSVIVSVAYGSDLQKVTDILLDVAKKHKKVLKNPAPYVMFQNFGASGLDFELRVYARDVWNGWIIPSDLRYEIDKKFREENIEIPFTQMVIHQAPTNKNIVEG